MLSTHTNTTTVGRLRIRSKSSDPQAEQQRMSRMLRATTLHPAALPQTAMLIVRRLVDPLPSRLRAGPLDTLPDSSWQRAVTTTLEKLAASAARPAYGFVPAESNAVLFLDRAEILAALALDWLSGTIASQWWWRELLREHDAITALLHEWVDSPQYVPGAVELLAQRKRVVQFIQRLPEPMVEEMLEAIIRVHAVPHPNLEQPFSHSDSGDRERQIELDDEISEKTTAPYRSFGMQQPWLPWIPEAVTPGLSTPQKMLLIQALMLRRAPTTAHALSFQKALLRWQAAPELSETKERSSTTRQWRQPQPAVSRPEQVTSRPIANALETTGPETSSSLPNPPAVHESLRDDPEPVTLDEPRRISNKGLKKVASHPAQPDLESTLGQPRRFAGDRESSLLQDAALRHEPTGITEAPDPRLRQEELAQPIEVVEREDLLQPSVTLETEYGGVFFFLGLALYLNIYSDFTHPEETGLELAIWDFLALMASEFTGRNVESDPLWTELAVLAGRAPSERPGLAFDPPNEWQLPSDWLDPFPENYDHDRILINGRLVLSHPAGFKVLDVPAGLMEENQPADRLQRWVGWMAAYLRARLVRALAREDAAEFLCHRRARVSLTLTHLDVTFSLDHHPIEIRIAGLDRNLGWIPAAGRYVAFHFE